MAGERSSVVIRDLFPLPLMASLSVAERGPTMRLAAGPQTLRLRRVLPGEDTGRRWLLEVAVEVPDLDPEQVLLTSEGYLVDGSDGSAIGVVDQVESEGDSPRVSGLVIAAGWFGRRLLRVDATAIEALLPDEQRVIVDESRLTPARDD